MKRRHHLRVILTVLLAGGLFAGGYWLGLSRRGEDTSTARAVSGKGLAGVSQRDGQGRAPWTDAPAAEDDMPRSVGGVLRILRIADPVKRMSKWSQMIEATDAAGAQVIVDALEAYYRSGVVLRDEDTSLLQFRQGQLLGSKCFEDAFILGPNGNIAENQRRKMRGWADADPKAAKAWVDAQEQGSIKQALLDSWFQGVAASHPGQAAASFAALSESSRESAVPALLGALQREQGIAGAVQWFDQTATQPGSGVPAQSTFEKLAWLVGQETEANPDSPLQFLRDPAHAPFLSPASFTSVMRNISTKSPGTTVALLGELSAGPRPFTDPQVRDVLRQTTQDARRSGLNSLGEWLKANPAHPLYNLTTRYFVEQAVQDDPASAAAWAAQISDPAIREEASRFLKQ